MLRVSAGLPPMPEAAACGGDAESVGRLAADAGGGGHIGEGAVAVVVVQGVPADAADEEIFVAIVVVIPHRHAEVEIEPLSGEARFNRYVFESAVALLAQEAVVIRRIHLLEIGRASCRERG